MWQAAKRRLAAAGFKVEEAVLKAERLGVPQLRRRLLVIVTKRGGRKDWEQVAAEMMRGEMRVMKDDFPHTAVF